MKVGLIGTGRLAGVLGERWAKAGHEVMVGSRDPERGAALAARLGNGSLHGTTREAAAHGDAVFLSVLWKDVPAALEAAGAADGVLAGKALLDPVNPVEVQNFTLVSGPTSAAEQIQEQAVGAHVVKAFNLCHMDVWSMEPVEFDGRPLMMPYAGDDPGAKALAAQLAADLGCRPLDLGPLHQARHLEAMAAIVIGQLYTGAPARTVLNFVTA
ncbi:MAG: NADPH-dependent F420 reductase [Mycobacteriales bacterium]